MRGVKYRYQILDDSTLKLAPTRRSVMTAVLALAAQIAGIIALNVWAKRAEARLIEDLNNETQPDIDPSLN